MVNITLKW